MNIFLFKNRKIILVLGILLLLCGSIIGILKWGIEPEKTIAGFLCGLGLGVIIISFAQKTDHINTAKI
jgi:hypothetical protein